MPTQEMPQVSSVQDLQRELADSIVRLAPLDDIRILLACGAKVNQPVTQGLRPLHYAVYQKYVEAVNLLLVRGSDVNARDDIGYTAIHLCAEHGFTDLIDLLIQYEAKVNWTDQIDDPMGVEPPVADEPLRLAIKNGHYETAKFLLDNGANVNAQYFLGSEINMVNPLDSQFLELLLMYGAYPDTPDRSGLTPLMKACRHPDGLESVVVLISYGANVNAMTSERHDYRTVLHYAVLSGNLKMVCLLLKQGSRVNFPFDYKKPTPLDFAILKGDVDMIKLLLDNGADLYAHSPLIGSPLHVACTDRIDNRFEIIETLCKRGADPNLYTVTESGPMLLIPLGEYLNTNPDPDPKILNLLLKYGTNVVLKTQFRDPNGIIKCLPKIAKKQEVFERVVEAAEAVQVGAVQRSHSISPAHKKLIVEYASSPLPLKHQLRIFHRKFFQQQLFAKNPKASGCLPDFVCKLPLPFLIKAYLLYEI